MQEKLTDFEKEYGLLETGHAFFSELFTIARHCVRLADELPKKSTERLREYRDSNLESLKFQLYSPAPLYPELERAKLTASLTFLAENLGGDHPVVKLVAGRQEPGRPARRIDRRDEALRSRGAEATGRRRQDGRRCEPGSARPAGEIGRCGSTTAAHALRDGDRGTGTASLRSARESAVQGSTANAVAPDATFTLRLALAWSGATTSAAKRCASTPRSAKSSTSPTALGGTEPFDLPKRWLEGKGKLDLSTPFNFVSTADTIGGNSGSPVLNRAGELVGVNFDRNRHGLVRNFVYTDVQARHIAVHSRAVLEALRKLYPAEALVQELTGNK